MTTIATTGARDELGSARRRSGDVWVDRSFRGAALGAGLSVLAILALIAYFTTKQAWPIFSHDAWGFVTGTRWDPNSNTFGALPFIYGTAVASTIALLLAVPLSIGIALFTNELAPRRLRKPVIYLVDLLAAIPSVVYGLWALAVLEKPARNTYQVISDTLGKIPVLGRVLGGVPSGASLATAGVVLAIMMIPIVTAISREVLATVSQDDKNAALAMGATRWEMLRACVFPRVRSGLVGAVMLGMGRALGETIAVALVIGSNQKVNSHIFQAGDSMASVIAHEFGEAATVPLYRAALIGLAVLLFLFTLVVNMLARWIANRSAREFAMTATVSAPPPAELPAWMGERSTSPRRRFANGFASAWMVGSVIIALIPLGFIAFYVIAKGISVISWSFLTRNIPIISDSASGGIGPAIKGTLMLTFVAAVLSVPLGVLAAIYLNEYGGERPTARVIRFMADVMTGVPSIVMGLFVAMIWVSAGLHRGFSTLAGAIALACLMLPIVIRSSEEMLRLVPDELRQASDALGARRWVTVTRVVLPAAIAGIVSGAMLAVARAAGETAPLLFTIGISRKFSPRLDAQNTALPFQIWNNAQDPVRAAQDRAWGAALTLIVLVFVLTVIARLVAARFSTAER